MTGHRTLKQRGALSPPFKCTPRLYTFLGALSRLRFKIPPLQVGTVQTHFISLALFLCANICEIRFWNPAVTFDWES